MKHDDGVDWPGTVTVHLQSLESTLFTLHWTLYDTELDDVFAGYVHVQFNDATFSFVYVVPFPQSIKIVSAISHLGDVPQDTDVLHHAFVNDVVSILKSSFEHIYHHKWCISSSHGFP